MLINRELKSSAEKSAEMKTQAQKDGVNDLGRVFGEPSAENNSASEVQGDGGGGGYLYPLNICRLYQQSLSSTKCHRTAAQLYSRVIPREGVALLMPCFQEKVSSVPPPREERGGGVWLCQVGRGVGRRTSLAHLCPSCACAVRRASRTAEKKGKRCPPLVLLETAGQC